MKIIPMHPTNREKQEQDVLEEKKKDLKDTLDGFLELVERDKPEKVILIAHGGTGELAWTHVHLTKQSHIESLGILTMARKALE